ncbi:MAG TPA: RodZ domain-containing protein [Gammaproteobacteria bacterium]|nr:RodZ domain-containing protein [Gammaproteobacteria bacterium]
MQEVPADKPSSSKGDSLGATLRVAREARGFSVHKTAQDMHVSDAIIEALEHDDFACLGAPIFVRGHLRNYARLLGLPEDEILAAEHTADKLAPPPLITLQPDVGRAFGRRFAMPIFSMIVTALLLALGIVWWQHRPAEQPAMVLVENGVTATTKPVVTAPDVASIRPMSSGSTDVSRLEAAADKSKVTSQYKLAPVPMAEIKQNPGIKSATVAAVRMNHTQISSPEAVTAPPSQLTHAQFTLTQPSWIEVYDASGKRLYYDLAPAGDTLKVSGTGPLQVFLGNAPGVSVELNGAPFNQTPFMHPDNTARFRLGETVNNSGQAG